MRPFHKVLWATSILLGLGLSSAAQTEPDWIDPLDETREQHDARMQWWRAARFGMFIHWGVYAVPAGAYDGRRIPGIGEWIMNRGKIPVEVYKTYAKRFDPVKYDPDAWVRLAKEAGMRYIVITSKHHDGFALFDSKVTTWDVVDATPYGKDLLAPLAEACRRHGLRLGFYYSQAQDWTHPGGAASGGHWDPAQDGDMDEYLKRIAFLQVQEILTRYGRLGVLWWDTPRDMTKERADLLRPLLRLQPWIITNNRLGGDYPGDFSTPEQRIPATGLDYDWETCMTMNDTWGFKSYDTNWKSSETLIRNLVDIASKGGNYLLNVGPTALGEIPEPSIERLKAIGAWMKTHGDAIYGTTASPFRRPRWGRCTKQALESGDTRLYLHVFEWPEDGELAVPLGNDVLACRLLEDPERRFEVRRDAEGLTVHVTGDAPDSVCSVIVLDVVGTPKVTRPYVSQSADGSIHLEAADALIHNPSYGGHAQYESGGAKDNIGYWTDARAWIEWECKVDEVGRFEIRALAATPASDVHIQVRVGEQEVQAAVPRTDSYDTYRECVVGEVDLPSPGVMRIAVRPVSEGWKPINLRRVVLVRKP